jgi:tetratricopeptide (TPR) repeat protein
MPKLVVIVGQLASMTRAEAARVIALTGGELTERVTRSTALLIVGGRGSPFQRSGRLPIQLARARRLMQDGVPLEVCPEEQWLHSIGLADERTGVCKRFTPSQIAATLNVPRSRLDRWIAAGLILPVEVHADVPLFEFRQVAAARTLADLMQSGVSLAKVRRAVAGLSKWLPATDQPLLELSLGEDVRRLVVRNAAGQLAEPSGQLLLEFDQTDSELAVAFCGSESDSDTFRRALACEEDRPLEAAAIYRELIAKRGPHATLAFNLANALYAADDVEGAQQAYLEATQLEPRHAGAWNNLANVHAELDQPEEAIQAYRRALALDSRLADARFNLAQTLVELGREQEAVLHWRAYLATDAGSNWADYARERLESSRRSD